VSSINTFVTCEMFTCVIAQVIFSVFMTSFSSLKKKNGEIYFSEGEKKWKSYLKVRRDDLLSARARALAFSRILIRLARAWHNLSLSFLFFCLFEIFYRRSGRPVSCVRKGNFLSQLVFLWIFKKKFKIMSSALFFILKKHHVKFTTVWTMDGGILAVIIIGA
jgi:hypothetical protein